MAVRALDDYFRAATTVALGVGAAPFVWLAMAFAAMITLIVSFASCCLLFYDLEFRATEIPTTNLNEETSRDKHPQRVTTRETATESPASEKSTSSVPTDDDASLETGVRATTKIHTLDNVATYIDRQKSLFFVPHGLDIQHLL